MPQGGATETGNSGESAAEGFGLFGQEWCVGGTRARGGAHMPCLAVPLLTGWDLFVVINLDKVANLDVLPCGALPAELVWRVTRLGVVLPV